MPINKEMADRLAVEVAGGVWDSLRGVMVVPSVVVERDQDGGDHLTVYLREKGKPENEHLVQFIVQNWDFGLMHDALDTVISVIEDQGFTVDHSALPERPDNDLQAILDSIIHEDDNSLAGYGILDPQTVRFVDEDGKELSWDEAWAD